MFLGLRASCSERLCGCAAVVANRCTVCAILRACPEGLLRFSVAGRAVEGEEVARIHFAMIRPWSCLHDALCVHYSCLLQLPIHEYLCSLGWLLGDRALWCRRTGAVDLLMLHPSGNVLSSFGILINVSQPYLEDNEQLLCS